jgi:hypothetical protein
MDEQGTRSRKPFPNDIPDEVFEHARRARDEIRRSFTALLPELPREFTEHRLAARKEMLLAFRSLIDSAIDRVEKTSAANAASKSKPAE